MPDWQRGDFSISSETCYLDLKMVQNFLANDAYWALGRTPEQINRSIDHSAMCFGIYIGQVGDTALPAARQVGFARLVSDMAVFAWLCDVFVLPDARGQGLGKWLVEVVVETTRAWGVRRVMLATRDAHGLYAGVGFRSLAEPGRWMELLKS